MNMFRRLMSTTALALALPFALFAQGHETHHPATEAAVIAVVEAFHAALAAGDTESLQSLLADDVRILEGGGVETAEEYASHHMEADIAFAKAVPRERSEPHVVVMDDVAWVTSTSRASGTYRGRDIDSRGGELMVLSRNNEGHWRIRSISWS